MFCINTENAEFQIIEALKLNRVKRAMNHEIFVEGIESIKQLIKAGMEITRIITTDEKSSWARGIIKQHEERNGWGPTIIEMADDLYRKLCDRGDPSEMLVTAAITAKKPDSLALPKNPFILVLDRTSDTGNLGSIIRSANSFGVDAVLIIGHAADIRDPKTIRASLGSVFFTTPVQLGSLKELEALIKSMKAGCGLEVWGTDSGGALSLADQKPKRPLMLILGNEAKGMSLGLIRLCGGIMGIPISGNVNSLNLASAASIFMWEVYRNSL
jgi:TrmH family RNA methyltransferase